MHRLVKTEDTPKKHHPEPEGSTVGGREATTKSGRKVKRPVHLDSPERSPVSPVPEGRKSVARKVKSTIETVETPVNRATPGRRALLKTDESADDVKKSRKALDSARKTVASVSNTPNKVIEKQLPDNKASATPPVDDSGISKSGRKIKVPAKLNDFESDILTSPRKAAPTVVVAESSRGEPQATGKTPGRPSRSAKKRTIDDDAEQSVEDEPGRSRDVRGKVVTKDGGRSMPRKTIAVSGEFDSTDATASSSSSSPPAPPKTPGRRAKSVGPTKGTDTEQQKETSSKTKRTPGRQASKPALKMRAESPDPIVSQTLFTRKTIEPSTESEEDIPQNVPKTGRTPGRPVLMKPQLDRSVVVSLTSLPRVGTSSLAPTKSAVEPQELPQKEPNVAAKVPVRTPGRRAVKSMQPITAGKTDQDDSKLLTHPEDVVLEGTGTETKVLSRSGRKLKPKKIFGIEQEENDEGRSSPVAGGRKRKLDGVDALADRAGATMSPRKKLTIDTKGIEQGKSSKSVAKADIDMEPIPVPQLVLKKPTKAIEGELKISSAASVAASTTPPTTAGYRATETEGHVSRSGRKIKAKKMFGFDDGDDGADLSSHSPTIMSPVKGTKKEKPLSAVSEKATKPAVKEAGSSLKPEGADKPNSDGAAKQMVDQFVTKRNIDDHHSLPTQVAPVDEPDRDISMFMQMPTVSRTSFVSSPMKKARPDSSIQAADRKVKTPPAPGTDTSTPESAGSSRSGRKIKPKKFFDDDSGNIAAGQSVEQRPSIIQERKETETTTTVAQQGISSSSASDDQGAEDNGAGVDIPEGPVPITTPGDTLERPVLSDGNPADVAPPVASVFGPIEEDPGRGDDGGEKVVSKNDSVASVSGPTEEDAGSGDDVGENVVSKNDTDNRTVPENGATMEDKEALGDIVTRRMTEEVVVNHPEPTIATPEEREMASDLPQHDISGESTIPQLKLDEEDLLANSSPFGEIEYLEDEAPNVVEHIRKPSSRAVSEEQRAAADVPSILVIPETPLARETRPIMDETFSPVKENQSGAGVVIDITADTPQVASAGPTAGATAPRTPDSKTAAQYAAGSKCSPDKPPEIIEIVDSPAGMAFCRQVDDDIVASGGGTASDAGAGGSATSTPLPVKVLMGKRACLLKKQNEFRKRSLSASAADTTIKRNVTFHSPANCTVLVDAIDERLKKSFQQTQGGEAEKSATKRSWPRKRSLSEHKPSQQQQQQQDEAKPNKISRKVPNFKNIHANHFDRMESIADFMKRKEQRAKEILTAASPATKLLSRPAAGTSAGAVPEKDVGVSTEMKPAPVQKPFIFKSSGIPLFGKACTANNVAAQQRAQPNKGTAIARPVLTAGSRAAAAMAVKQPRSTNMDHTATAAQDGRLVNRLQQCQAAFKRKQLVSGDATSSTVVPPNGPASSTHQDRPVEQLRSKQSKILKGVRTNRRFELQMKHRDNLQQP